MLSVVFLKKLQQKSWWFVFFLSKEEESHWLFRSEVIVFEDIVKVIHYIFIILIYFIVYTR